MATPRKFSEKIALHNQKQAEETAAFEQIMREVSDATSRVKEVSPVNTVNKHHLHISQNLGSYRGGSLPNVNQIATNSIDRKPPTMEEIAAAESMGGGMGGGGNSGMGSMGGGDMGMGMSGGVRGDPPSVSPQSTSPQMMFPRDRGRGGGPVRARQRLDTSPYGADRYGAYLSPPPDTNWRRANSDSALHQNAQGPPEPTLHNSGSPTPPRRGTLQQVLDGHQGALALPDSLDASKRQIAGLQEGRPKSCCDVPRVPGINVFPSQQEPGTIQIPISNNTGSLPDLTTFHFPPPLQTPIDAEDHSSSPYSTSSQGASPSTLSPSSISPIPGGGPGSGGGGGYPSTTPPPPMMPHRPPSSSPLPLPHSPMGSPHSPLSTSPHSPHGMGGPHSPHPHSPHPHSPHPHSPHPPSPLAHPHSPHSPHSPPSINSPSSGRRRFQHQHHLQNLVPMSQSTNHLSVPPPVVNSRFLHTCKGVAVDTSGLQLEGFGVQQQRPLLSYVQQQQGTNGSGVGGGSPSSSMMPNSQGINSMGPSSYRNPTLPQLRPTPVGSPGLSLQTSPLGYRSGSPAETSCSAPQSPVSQSLSPVSSPGIGPAPKSPFSDQSGFYVSQAQTNALQQHFEQFRVTDNPPVSSSLNNYLGSRYNHNVQYSQPLLSSPHDSSAVSQGSSGGSPSSVGGTDLAADQGYFSPSPILYGGGTGGNTTTSSTATTQSGQQQQQQQQPSPQTPQTPSSIPDIILTGETGAAVLQTTGASSGLWNDIHAYFSSSSGSELVREVSNAMALSGALSGSLSGSFDATDLFTSDESLKEGLDPIDFDGLQMLTDPDMTVVTDPSTEDNFRLDRL